MYDQLNRREKFPCSFKNLFLKNFNLKINVKKRDLKGAVVNWALPSLQEESL